MVTEKNTIKNNNLQPEIFVFANLTHYFTLIFFYFISPQYLLFTKGEEESLMYFPFKASNPGTTPCPTLGGTRGLRYGIFQAISTVIFISWLLPPFSRIGFPKSLLRRIKGVTTSLLYAQNQAFAQPRPLSLHFFTHGCFLHRHICLMDQLAICP